MILDDPTINLGAYINENCTTISAVDVLARLVSICTMNESVVYYKQGTNTIEDSAGNPTEVALLVLVHDVGMDYESIRNSTRGRSSVGVLGDFLGEGKLYDFSSARKMMSWAVPSENGYRRMLDQPMHQIFERVWRSGGHEHRREHQDYRGSSSVC